jgi:hypothetical protein
VFITTTLVTAVAPTVISAAPVCLVSEIVTPSRRPNADRLRARCREIFGDAGLDADGWACSKRATAIRLDKKRASQ